MNPLPKVANKTRSKSAIVRLTRRVARALGVRAKKRAGRYGLTAKGRAAIEQAAPDDDPPAVGYHLVDGGEDVSGA